MKNWVARLAYIFLAATVIFQSCWLYKIQTHLNNEALLSTIFAALDQHMLNEITELQERVNVLEGNARGAGTGTFYYEAEPGQGLEVSRDD